MKRVLACFLITVFFSYTLHSQTNTLQTIRGIITEEGSKLRIEGATIVINEIETYAVSDKNGEFRFSEIPVGRYSITTSIMGYYPHTLNEILTSSGRECVLEIALKEQPFELKGAVVKPAQSKERPINDMAFVSARTFSVEESSRFAGVMDDPGRMAANYAGVTTAGVTNNAVVIRGNAPKGILWRVEGMEIPMPNHFSESNVAGGGGLTIFSSSLMANSDFFTGAFPAEYSNAMSGVFDIRFRNGNNIKREMAVQAGIQGIELAGEGPFKQGSKSSYLFNYRYSTLGLIFKLLPETKDGNEKPVYQDLSFKINAPIKRVGTLSVWGIGGLSQSTIKGFNNPERWIYPENRVNMNFKYNMGATGISLFSRISDKTTITNSLGTSYQYHSYKNEFYKSENDTVLLNPLHSTQNSQTNIIFNSVINHKASKRLSFRAGVGVTYRMFNLNGSTVNFDNGLYVPFMKGEGESFYNYAFLQSKYNLSPKINITAGINASYFGKNSELIIEPRLSAQYALAQNHILSAGYGMHSQSEMLFIYHIEGQNNNNLKREKSNHFIFGYDWNISSDMRFKTELYYQYLYDVPVVPGSHISLINFKNNWAFNEPLTNEGKGYNTGIEFTFERFLKDGFYFITTASLYKSRYTGGDGIERKTRYDGTFAINLLAGKEIVINTKNLLGINIRCSFRGPELCQPIDEALSHQYGEIIFDYTRPLYKREGAIENATDINITYRINLPKKAHTISLQAKNIIGKEYRGKRYNLKTNNIEDEYFSSIVPFISYRIEF